MRSSVRYWIASLRCLGSMSGAASRSAISARHFQNAVVSSREKPQAGHRVFQQLFTIRGDSAVFAHRLRRHLRVRIGFLLGFIASDLLLLSGNHPATHGPESSEDDGARSSLYFTAGTSI